MLGQATGITTAVQKAQRVAFMGMSLRRSGQARVVGAAGAG
jgi:hypothetical protein